MIPNHCLLLPQHHKQLGKSDENTNFFHLHIVDGFHPPKRVILKNYLIVYSEFESNLFYIKPIALGLAKISLASAEYKWKAKSTCFTFFPFCKFFSCFGCHIVSLNFCWISQLLILYILSWRILPVCSVHNPIWHPETLSFQIMPSTAWKVSVFGVIPVRIFPAFSHTRTEYGEIRSISDWIRRDTEYLSVFSPNAGKCGKNADRNNSEYGLFLRSVGHDAASST